jgi:hypothetical protein
MRRLSQLTLCLAIAGLAPFALADAGRYLSWVDDSGQVHNTFVEAGFGRQQRQAEQRISQSDGRACTTMARRAAPAASRRGKASAAISPGWMASGNLQNSFYAANQVPGGRADYVLPSGERSSEYIDAEAYEDKGFVRSENGNPYYTWVDEQGRMHNSPISAEERAAGIRRSQIAFSDGRQVEFDQRPQALPDWMAPVSRAMPEGPAQRQWQDARRPLPGFAATLLRADRRKRLHRIERRSAAL